MFRGIKYKLYLQLDWPQVAEWAYAGIFPVAVQFQNQDQIWISHQKKTGFFFFEKSKHELVQPKMMFWVILAKIRSFPDTSDM